MPKPKVGEQWRLTETIGNETNTDGTMGYPLMAGQIGTVRELVPAEEPGAHDDSEDSAVLEFPTESESVGGGLVQVARAVSFGLGEFNKGGILEKIEEG